MRQARGVRSWIFDLGVTVGVALTAVMEGRVVRPGVVVIGVLMAVALLPRRRFPLPVLAVVYGLAVAQLFVHGAVRLFDAAVLIAMSSVVTYCPRLRWGVAAGLGAGLGVVLGAAAEARRSDNFWSIFAIVGAATVTTWFTAYGVRTRRLAIATLQERTATLERERHHLARLAAADERAAIARELHDVVAHSLSVMIVQADGATYTVDEGSTKARAALATIASTGREALDDMRRVVAVLRGTSAGPVDSARRRVGLAELDVLLERAATAGLRVAVERVGAPTRLSAAEELTTYRIVQESLTNTLRHAGPEAAVTLRLEYGPERVSIEACDDGGRRVLADRAAPGGHGLIGMRERVAVHGGDLAVGPRPGGGWRVAATLPLASGAPR